MARLKDLYYKEVLPKLKKSRGFTNDLQVPQFKKIVVNMGFDASVEKDVVKTLTEELGAITGQKPVLRKASKSIANFKLREGMPVGLKVTLRGNIMYEFYDRLVNVVLPRLRDFRGVSATAFDHNGNYTLGLSEQSIFPEINPDKIKKVQGMDITIVTSAGNDEDARELLVLMGMPFARVKQEQAS